MDSLRIATRSYTYLDIFQSIEGKDAAMSDTQQGDWTQPAAMAIPKGGIFKDKVQQGRYGPIFPKSSASYAFTTIEKIISSREEIIHEYAKNIEKAVAGQPDCV